MAMSAPAGKAEKAQASIAVALADTQDERWTRVKVWKKKAMSPQDRLSKLQTTVAAPGATTSNVVTMSATGNSSSVMECTTEDELLMKWDQKQITLIKELSVTSSPDAPPCVAPMRPLLGEQPAKGFAWEHEGSCAPRWGSTAAVTVGFHEREVAQVILVRGEEGLTQLVVSCLFLMGVARMMVAGVGAKGKRRDKGRHPMIRMLCTVYQGAVGLALSVASGLSQWHSEKKVILCTSTDPSSPWGTGTVHSPSSSVPREKFSRNLKTLLSSLASHPDYFLTSLNRTTDDSQLHKVRDINHMQKQPQDSPCTKGDARMFLEHMFSGARLGYDTMSSPLREVRTGPGRRKARSLLPKHQTQESLKMKTEVRKFAMGLMGRKSRQSPFSLPSKKEFQIQECIGPAVENTTQKKKGSLGTPRYGHRRRTVGVDPRIFNQVSPGYYVELIRTVLYLYASVREAEIAGDPVMRGPSRPGDGNRGTHGPTRQGWWLVTMYGAKSIVTLTRAEKWGTQQLFIQQEGRNGWIRRVGPHGARRNDSNRDKMRDQGVSTDVEANSDGRRVKDSARHGVRDVWPAYEPIARRLASGSI
ncbi:hypothetical protein EDB84DRAFT_1654762 [Lactarius hengduanensis]|nr:hypothetical protein EDB84DRAFT_1654762 [Lactarius hengduanensis]